MSDARALLRAHIEAKHNAGRTTPAKTAEAFARPQSGFLDPHRGPIPAGDRDRVLTTYLRLQAGKGHNRQELEALVTRRWQDAEQPAGDEYPLEAALAKVSRALEKFAPVNELPEGVSQAVRDELGREGVARELARIQDRRAAQRIDAEIEALRNPKPSPDLVSLDELLERPIKYSWLVEGLAPAGGNVLVIAPAKTGKTTLVGSLVYSLMTGEPFLGRHAVRRVEGSIVMLNYEVTPETFGAWLRDLGLSRKQQKRVVVLNLRGRENPLATETGRAWLSSKLRELGAEVMTVDPFTEAFTGTSQDNNTEVSQFLTELRRVATEGGVQELFLVAHAGHQSAERGATTQVRVRGASVLEGWTDANWRLSKPAGIDGDPRFIEADGRDVRLEKDRLDFDPLTRRLTLSGAGGPVAARTAAKVEQLAQPIVEIVTTQGGVSSAGIADALRRAGVAFRKGDEAAATKTLVQDGRIARHRDGKTMRHWIPSAVPKKFRQTFPFDSTSTEGK